MKFEDSKGMKKAYKKLADDMRKRVEKADELVNELDTTEYDVVADVKLSLMDHIREAHAEAVKRNIKANSVFLNKNFAAVESFMMRYGNDASKFPPMICGLEVHYTDELPDDFTFAVTEVPYTERESLILDTTKITAKDLLISLLWDVKLMKKTSDHYLLDEFEQSIKFLAGVYGVEEYVVEVKDV